MTRISTYGRSVSGHVVSSAIFHSNEFLYNFETVVYQFLETGTSDRTNIGRDQLLKFLGLSPYPLSVYFNSPFKGC